MSKWTIHATLAMDIVNISRAIERTELSEWFCV